MSSVYSIRNEDLEKVRVAMSKKSEKTFKQRELRKKSLHEEIFFFGAGEEREGVWRAQVDQGAVNAGNEARPHTETSVYVRYAVIVRQAQSETK